MPRPWPPCETPPTRSADQYLVPAARSPRTSTATPGTTSPTPATASRCPSLNSSASLPTCTFTTPAVHTSDDFPIVLAAGQRRSFTANTVFRDNTWRKRDPQGALRVSPHDAEQLGLSDGVLAQITTQAEPPRRSSRSTTACHPARGPSQRLRPRPAAPVPLARRTTVTTAEAGAVSCGRPASQCAESTAEGERGSGSLTTGEPPSDRVGAQRRRAPTRHAVWAPPKVDSAAGTVS